LRSDANPLVAGDAEALVVVARLALEGAVLRGHRVERDPVVRMHAQALHRRVVAGEALALGVAFRADLPRSEGVVIVATVVVGAVVDAERVPDLRHEGRAVGHPRGELAVRAGEVAGRARARGLAARVVAVEAG